MNPTIAYNKIVLDLGLESLQEEDKQMIITELGNAVQKEFLQSVYDILGDEKFQALIASSDMGKPFYETSLKHLVPNHEELLDQARTKILNTFKNGLPSENQA